VFFIKDNLGIEGVDVEESKQCWDCSGSWLDWLDPSRNGLVVFALHSEISVNS
jgi:hypothetical protein